MTLLTFRRGSAFCALATTLAAGCLSLSACSTEQVSDQASDQQAERVATAMGTDETEAQTSVGKSVTQQSTASRETTLTSQAFMDYLDEAQQTQLLGSGLNLDELTWAQQITAKKVLETLLNADAYQTVSAVLDHLGMQDNPQHHYLKFSAEPNLDEQWKLQLDGPVVGLTATFSPDGEISFESAHLGLSPADLTAITGADGTLPVTDIHQSALNLYDSLSPAQRDALFVPSDSTAEGLKGSELSEEQKQMLIDVTTNWIDLSDQSSTAAKQAEISATLDETYFSWSDATSMTFCINGPEVFIEYSEASTGTDGSIHSVFRDPSVASVEAGAERDQRD